MNFTHCVGVSGAHSEGNSERKEGSSREIPINVVRCCTRGARPGAVGPRSGRGFVAPAAHPAHSFRSPALHRLTRLSLAAPCAAATRAGVRRLWRSARSAVAAAIACAVLSAPARALVVVERDFAALVALAEQIVEGTVVAVEQSTDPRGVARTLISLSDLLVLKGEVAGDRFVIDIAGGERNGLRSVVLDLPELKVGERYVLFVAGNGRAVFPVVGIAQGVFQVVRDPERQAEVVLAYDGSPVSGRQGRRLVRRERAFAPAAAISVQEFRNWVAEEMANPSR